MTPWVVIRTKNNMQTLPAVLASLKKQTIQCKVLVCDNGSTDGTFEYVWNKVDKVHQVPADNYKPGRVLNEAMMRLPEEDVIVFLNSDCIVQEEDYLEQMLRPFESKNVGAVFSRQVAAESDPKWYKVDMERAFSEKHKGFIHFFSMASSAVRRSVWDKCNFDNHIQYSEDIDWSWRVKSMGYEIEYVSEASVVHSHQYSLGEVFKRQFGEGFAEASALPLSQWRRTKLRYFALPLIASISRDLIHKVKRPESVDVAQSLSVRLAQHLGRSRGFYQAMKGL